jgi:hypothetical protein
MYGLRREGENTRNVEIKAAATEAKMALIEGFTELCGFIYLLLLLFLIRIQIIALILTYARVFLVDGLD